MTFSELGLAECVLRAVDAEGYIHPTPIQSQAIPPMLAGRDLLGCAQTGTGKTAAFALPILQRLRQQESLRQGPRPDTRAACTTRRIRALILAPTRELAHQIGQSFAAYGRHAGLRHTVIFGGVGQQPQTQALRQGVDILIATPGRLLDLIGQGFVDLATVEVFVLDEADRMLDMGFLPDVRRVIARLPARRQTVMFSATMPEPIEELAGAVLCNPARIRIAPVQATTELIQQSVVFVPREHKPELLARLLGSRPITRALVFTRTKHGADRVARQLHRAGIRAGVLHGNKSQSARQRTLEEFKSNRAPVLVATDLAARGIDVDGISHVFNYDLPHEPETYVHRIGRTGRAGASGFAVSFCEAEQHDDLLAIERLIRQTLREEEDLPLRCLPRPSERPQGAHGQQRPQHGHRRSARAPHAGRAKQAARPQEAGGKPRTSAGHSPRAPKKIRRVRHAL